MRSKIALVLASILLLTGTAFADSFTLRSPQVNFGTSSDGSSAYLWLNTSTIGGPWVGYTEAEFKSEQIWSESWYANADVMSTLVLEIAGNSGSNAFGIYDLSNPSSRTQIFAGSASAPTTVTINVPYTLFGFYLQGPGGTFFSQDGLNSGAAAQMIAYYSLNNSKYSGTDKEFLLAWEDLVLAGADRDYNDLVVRVKGASPVPEPISMLLFGTGLIGVGGYVRRKLKS